MKIILSLVFLLFATSLFAHTTIQCDVLGINNQKLHTLRAHTSSPNNRTVIGQTSHIFTGYEVSYSPLKILNEYFVSLAAFGGEKKPMFRLVLGRVDKNGIMFERFFSAIKTGKFKHNFDGILGELKVDCEIVPAYIDYSDVEYLYQ